MSELVNIAEIHSRYRSEWVLLVGPVTDEWQHITAGTVVFHSADRDQVYRKAIDLQTNEFAVVFTGTIPQDTAVVL